MENTNQKTVKTGAEKLGNRTSELNNLLNYIKFNSCTCNLGDCEVCKTSNKIAKLFEEAN